MTVWNQAAFKHRTPPRKYKPVGPVGKPVQTAGVALISACPTIETARRVNTDRACGTCGYFVCSCEPISNGNYARQRPTPHIAELRAMATEMYERSMDGLPAQHWFFRYEKSLVVDAIAEKLKETNGRPPIWGPSELRDRLEMALARVHLHKVPYKACMSCGRRNTMLRGRVCADERSCYETYCRGQGSEAMK